MRKILCPCGCQCVIAEDNMCQVCGKTALCTKVRHKDMQYLDVCSECLAAADSHQLKQVIHMSVPKHKELCDQIATLQKRQLELGMKNDAMAVAVQATWAAWTEGGDFNVAKRMVKRAMDLIK